MDLGQTVGTGRTADVLAIDSGRVLKRFDAGTPVDVARREADNARTAEAAGLPVPTVHEVTAVDGRPAIVFDRIDGPSMRSRLRSRPWTIRRYAHRLASLHATLHDSVPSGGPSFRERVTRDVEAAPGLSPAARDRVLAALDALVDGNTLCHGDFHPGNVLLADDGPVVIDWPDAGVGHPAADVARTSLLLRFGGRRAGSVLSGFRRVFRWLYLRHYCRQRDVSRTEIRDWELPIAAARLTEAVPEEPQLRSFVHARLADD